jgi:diguanylate cyclase (GGDEF)-like protein/PAS domain S-box-containing protein
MTPPKKTSKAGNILQPISREKAKLPSRKHPVHRADVPGTLENHDIKASEVRYRRLFETAKDGILILDGDTGRITDANPFLQDMLGYSMAELIGKALWEIGPVKDIPASLEAMRHLQDRDYIRYEDLPLETKAGERKQVEFVSNVYLVDGWRVIQCNIRDITARKHAEASVNTANDELTAMVKELQWRDKLMQLMNHMNDLLQSCVTQEEAYQVISLSAGDLFPGHNGALAILSAQDRGLEVVARWGTEEIMESTFSLDDCWALRRGQLHEVSDPQAGLMCHHFFHLPGHGYLCVPLIVAGKILGLLSLIDNDKSEQGQHPHGLKQLAVTIGETIKLSLANLELRGELQEQAIHDPLTGLFNRRYLDEVLQRELDVAQRRNSSVCVVMLDIDGFKQFNDRLGHGAGDVLLREFSQIMRNHLRKSDIICRYGGDEFVVIMPDSFIHDTQERVECIRVLLKGLPKIHSNEKVPGIITLSAGMAFMPEHGTTEGELLRAADKAMYMAKKSGRDQVVVYQTKL